MRHWIPFALGLLTAVLLWGCSGSTQGPGTGGPVRRDMALGDRRKDWAFVYYQSWRRDRNAEYLRLARAEMAAAVEAYFALQVRIGHSYPDFYDLDRRRRESCRFLREMDRDAGKFRIALNDLSRDGCFF